MVAYLDASVVLQHILAGDEGIRQPLSCNSIVSSELLEIECKRVIHRYRLEGDLDDTGYLQAVERLEKVLTGISLITLSDNVKKRACEAFPIVIKTLDSLHLASALIFIEHRKEETLLLFSYDEAFNRCARALGFHAPFSTE